MAAPQQTPFIESEDPSIEHGGFAPPRRDPAPSNVIIASFNIRYAVGPHLISGSLFRRVGLGRPRHRPRLVSGHIERAGAFFSNAAEMPRVDILALQEADKLTERAGQIHVARELARALQMHYVHASLNSPRGQEQKSKQWYLDFEEHIQTNETGDTGLATLSRFPIPSTTRVDLPWSECEWRPRLAIESIVPIGKESLYIYNAHIDPHASTDDKLEQHRAIIARADLRVGPTIILGDFNTLTPEARARMRGLLESNGYTTPIPDGVATWRAGLIRLQPDWVFLRNVRVSRWGVARGLSISDHWPVWVEIELDQQDNDPEWTRV